MHLGFDWNLWINFHIAFLKCRLLFICKFMLNRSWLCKNWLLNIKIIDFVASENNSFEQFLNNFLILIIKWQFLCFSCNLSFFSGYSKNTHRHIKSVFYSLVVWTYCELLFVRVFFELIYTYRMINMYLISYLVII